MMQNEAIWRLEEWLDPIEPAQRQSRTCESGRRSVCLYAQVQTAYQGHLPRGCEDRHCPRSVNSMAFPTKDDEDDETDAQENSNGNKGSSELRQRR